MASALAIQSPGPRPPYAGRSAQRAPNPSRAETLVPWARRLQIVTRDDGAEETLPAVGGERVIEGADRVEFLFQIEGSSRLVRNGHADIPLAPGDGLVAFHAAAAPARWCEEGRPHRRVSVQCDTQLLQRMLPDGDPCRSSLADCFAAGQTIGIRYDPAIWRVAERLIGYEGDRHWPDLLVQAKAIELLCAGVRAMLEPPEGQDRARVALSDRDVGALNAARQHIVTHLADAPTIQQIARTVGLNQQKLKVGFRELFGETIYAFTLARRMDLAWRLLDQERQPIKIVAARVGYRCTNSFARAFERHWGMLPSAVRRGVAQAPAA